MGEPERAVEGAPVEGVLHVEDVAVGEDLVQVYRLTLREASQHCSPRSGDRRLLRRSRHDRVG